jgi:hypothetical protein
MADITHYLADRDLKKVHSSYAVTRLRGYADLEAAWYCAMIRCPPDDAANAADGIAPARRRRLVARNRKRALFRRVPIMQTNRARAT